MIKKISFLILSFSLFNCSKKIEVTGFSMEKTFYAGQTIRVKKKFGKPKRNDVVFFKTPLLLNEFDLSRVLGLPGEVLELKNSQLYINGSFIKDPKKLQLSYIITTDGTPFDKTKLNKIGIKNFKYLGENKYELFLTLKELIDLQSIDNISNIEQNLVSELEYCKDIFPQNLNYKWNRDNFGPIKIPKKGDRVVLTSNNISLYIKILSNFEKNTDITEEQFVVDLTLKKEYIFKNNYYMLISDNRAVAIDSRYCGFIPEQSIFGKVKSSPTF